MDKRALKVCFVMDALDGGGAERMVVELLRKLDRSQIKPSLFLIWRRGVHLGDVPPDVNITWALQDGQLVRNHGPRFLARLLKAVRDCDVVVGGVQWLPSYFAWIGAALCRKPLVGWIHTDLQSAMKHQPSWILRAARILYPRFDKVVVLTPAAQDSLRAVADIAPERVRVIPNFIDGDKVRQLAEEPLPSWAAEMTSKPFIVGLGRLVNRIKGFDTLVRAHAQVRSAGIDSNLVILGEGEDRAALQQLAEELGVRDSVFMPGFQTNPFPIVKRATALAAPSRVEGFGLVLVEAMSLGVPVIASNSSGPSAILKGSEYGLCLGHEDPEGLSRAMQDILTSQSLRQDFSRRAFKRSVDYEPANIVSSWEDLCCNEIARR